MIFGINGKKKRKMSTHMPYLADSPMFYSTLCSMVRILLLFNKTWKESHQAKKVKYIGKFFPESNTKVKFWQMPMKILKNILPKFQCLQWPTTILLQCLIQRYCRSTSNKIVHNAISPSISSNLLSLSVPQKAERPPLLCLCWGHVVEKACESSGTIYC